MNYLKITLDQLLSILSYGVDVQVRDSDTDKVIIHSFSALGRSKDKRQINRFNFYKDVQIWKMRPAISVPKYLSNNEFCRAILVVYIDSDDHDRVEKALKAIKESNK